jgi:hypothetical protein
MSQLTSTDLATEEDLREMVELLGDYLDKWCEQFRHTNTAQTLDEWVTIASYNLLEVVDGLPVGVRDTMEATALRDELVRGVRQVVWCLLMAANSVSVPVSELLLGGGLDFLRFQDERYGRSVRHRLRRAALERTKQLNLTGNHEKVLNDGK